MRRESFSAFPVAVLASLLMLAPSAEARIGENYKQCVARYGNSVTNFPGLSHLLGVAVFEKSGINIAVAFDKPNKQGFLVLYTAGDFFTSSGRRELSELKENELSSLMASVDTGWDSADYDVVNQKQKQNGGGNSRIDPSMRTMADTRSGKIKATRMVPVAKKQGEKPHIPKWVATRDNAQSSVKAFIEAITLEKVLNGIGKPYLRKAQVLTDKWSIGSRFLAQYALQPYRRSGDHLFAFKLNADGNCYGLVIVNSDASKAFSAWAEAYSKTCEIVVKEDKGRVLEGF